MIQFNISPSAYLRLEDGHVIGYLLVIRAWTHLHRVDMAQSVHRTRLKACSARKTVFGVQYVT